jgi:hypothetical protein
LDTAKLIQLTIPSTGPQTLVHVHQSTTLHN